MSTDEAAKGAALFAGRGDKANIEEGARFAPKFDEHGLIPAIATDIESGEVLMFAWMNAEALSLTIQDRTAHFYSRSRKRLWKKGEESGNVLDVAEIHTDCDQDVVWLKVRVRGEGQACHTARRTCFYRRLILEPDVDEPVVLGKEVVR